MNPTIQIIKQDIKAAMEYFKTKNFELVGIMGNRIMSNLLIGEKKEFMALGYLIKEISDEFQFIKQEDPVRLNGCMDAGKLFIQELLDSISMDGERDPLKIWEVYLRYKRKIVEFIPTDVELAVYEEIPEFTRMTTEVFMEFLDKNRPLLLENYNNLLVGILNEENRVINLHGFQERDLLFYILIKAFHEYYLYLLAFKIVSGVEGDVIKDQAYSYVNRITHLPAEFEELCQEANEILGELGYQTRVFYIENLDPEETIRMNLRRF